MLGPLVCKARAGARALAPSFGGPGGRWLRVAMDTVLSVVSALSPCTDDEGQGAVGAQIAAVTGGSDSSSSTLRTSSTGSSVNEQIPRPPAPWSAPPPTAGAVTCNGRMATIEIYSGCGSLSSALRGKGFKALEYDKFTQSAQHDMATVGFKNKLVARLGKGDIMYVHAGTPCNSFSMARWPKLRSMCNHLHACIMVQLPGPHVLAFHLFQGRSLCWKARKQQQQWSLVFLWCIA